MDELSAVCEESDKAELQVAVIARLVAHKVEAERERRQLHARLSRLLTHGARTTERGEASETAESWDTDAATDVTPAQLEANWSVLRALHSRLAPTGPLAAALTLFLSLVGCARSRDVAAALSRERQLCADLAGRLQRAEAAARSVVSGALSHCRQQLAALELDRCLHDVVL